MKKITPTQSTATNRQQGFVLVTAVMLMVILTIVILSMLRTTILEERMVGNSRDWNNAFQAAEAALRDAEREILIGSRVSGQTGFVAGCSSTGLCLPNTCQSSANCSPIWIQLTDSGWKSGTGTSKSLAYGSQTSAAALPGFSAQPRYIIEALSVTTGTNSAKTTPGGATTSTLYRVTAVGFGLNTSSRVMLQSVIRPNK
jgi:type IV pilus assembly protein PilX